MVSEDEFDRIVGYLFFVVVAFVAIAFIFVEVSSANDTHSKQSFCETNRPSWASYGELAAYSGHDVCKFISGMFGDYGYKQEVRYLVDGNHLGVEVA